jgi:hypothetical protein
MTDDSFVNVILKHKNYICEETKCENLSFGDLSDYDEKDIHEIEIDGYKIRLGMKEFI